MTDKAAIRELREKVEAGGDAGFVSGLSDDVFPEHLRQAVANAYAGSLDAALALYEAVLPGWAIERMHQWPGKQAFVSLWGTHEHNGGRWHHPEDGRVEAEAETLARALLIAILKAMEND